MAGLLEGKVAVISGGATGSGLATAKKLVSEGAYVFIMGCHKPELDAAMAAIGEQVTAVEGDVTELAQRWRVSHCHSINLRHQRAGRAPHLLHDQSSGPAPARRLS